MTLVISTDLQPERLSEVGAPESPARFNFATAWNSRPLRGLRHNRVDDGIQDGRTFVGFPCRTGKSPVPTADIVRDGGVLAS